MFSGWTSYFFPGTGSSPKADENVDNTVEIKEMDLDSENDWVMVTNVTADHQSLNPSVNNDGDQDIHSIQDEKDNEGQVLWENLLIEHPSMSVYLHPLKSMTVETKLEPLTETKEKRQPKKKSKKQNNKSTNKKDDKQVDSCEKKPVVFETSKTLKSLISESKEMVKKRAMESKRFSKNVKQFPAHVFTKRSNRMGCMHNSWVNNDRKCCRLISVTSNNNNNKRCC